MGCGHIFGLRIGIYFVPKEESVWVRFLYHITNTLEFDMLPVPQANPILDHPIHSHISFDG